MQKILGLDIGINSIGWCLQEDNKQIIDSGVRIFPVGVKEDDYNKSGSEISKSTARRDSRSARRVNYRYKLRRSYLLTHLTELKMLPLDELVNLTSVKLYALRKKALDEKIQLQEIGRIFTLLNQRRGFKSNKKEKGLEKAKERSQIKIAMHDLEAKIIENNCRTLGEYFYLLYSKNAEDPNCFNKEQPIESIRKRFVERKLYSQEFDAIWEKQKEFYPQILTEENKKKIKDDCIFYQRPLKSQKHLVGKCRFEPKKRCCPVSSFEFQEFRIWQTISNIRVTNSERFRAPLTFEEKIKIASTLERNENLSLCQIKKELKLSSSAQFNELPEKIKGNTTNARIAKAIGDDAYYSLSQEIRMHLWHILFFATDEEWLYKHVREKFNFSEEQSEKFSEITLEEEYSGISLKALLKGAHKDTLENGILYHLKTGMDYAEAAIAAGYHHSFDEKANDPNRVLEEKIIIKKEDQIKNPLVQQCISESVRLVNAIIRKYGRPDMIRIEMARSLKKPKNEREKIKRNNDEKQRKREEYTEFLKRKLDRRFVGRSDLIKFELFLEMQYAEDDLRKLNGKVDTDEFKKFARNIRSADKEKYELWLECGRISPYSGRVINLTELFSPEIEIEHIMPYSRCMDDSFMNKTLCERTINEQKKNRSPYEFFGHDLNKWKEFKDRIRNFNDRKQEQFTRQELPEGFLNSQLNNTAYVAREVVKHFKRICYDVRVTNGQATNHLRRFWGLNELLNPDGLNEKSRDDHRHHTIDAIAIAFTNDYYINLLSRHSRFEYTGRMRVENMKLPYADFVEEVKEKLQKIFVSYRNKKRLLTVKNNKYRYSKSGTKPIQKTFQVRGSLHEETNYGVIKNPHTGIKDFVVRKLITSIETDKQIEKIIDPKIREIVKKHIAENGGKPTQALKIRVSMKTKNGMRVPILKVRMVDNAKNLIQLRPKENPKLFVSSGNNYAIAIYEGADGKRDYQTISFYDAVKRKKQGQPVIPLNKDNKHLLFSLKQKDMIVIYNNHPDEIDLSNQAELFKKLYQVVKFNVNGQISLALHNYSNINTDRPKEYPEGAVINTRNTTIKAIKVKVDTLGTIEKA
jgi:CRISPR-associated endonuclease Csn1